MDRDYVFTWAGWNGPQVRRFNEARDLLAYLAGWCEGETVSVVSEREVRG